MLPPPEAVRVEEVINYFPARYAPPANDDFAVYSEMAPSPFSPGSYLLRIGIKGREIAPERRKPVRLALVVDTSGSMEQERRLELVKSTIRDLVSRLEPGDQIGIAAFQSQGYRVLDSTDVRDSGRIMNAVEGLRFGGSTNAEEGLQIGYAIAREHYERHCANRVMLFSDGVANAGFTSPEAILETIRSCARDRIYLTTVGVGMGNHNDALLEQVADQGNGHYLYIDDETEARKGIERTLAAMEVIAQDVKIQVEFNPAAVASYRLFGFENRKVADRDFRNDRVDAGEVGAGHSATALYEITLRGRETTDERIGSVSIRYKEPEDKLKAREIRGDVWKRDVLKSFDAADRHFRLTAAAAGFAEGLRNSYWARDLDMRAVAQIAGSVAREEGSAPEEREFADLADSAEQMLARAELPAPHPPETEISGDLEADTARPLAMRGVRERR